ncbi:arginine--tRNA ligase [Spiroplasma endosymbiont of Danaus chrysippus]|uniref:arginine--tRNA ligase n=1 Tax=Spiroplasma endosymbiont of Danaus chrysippus TaxID=2691041 RepID=UPI0013C846A4|nr:arginine--tRNA ligase [Spiroplasma endosymbiont of Danaus chrysippus]CAB1053699.1 Arginyl-tRNA synthetase (EC 6.1.1.19) [Spiroplasma endosymbiont of Danaus chrysippus]
MDSYVINELTTIILDAVAFANYEIELNQVVIEINKNNDLGDYSTSIAMILAKKYKQKPLDIAEIIVKNIHQKHPLIKKIDYITPGFINININVEVFSLLLMKIINEKSLYGQSNKKNITYNIEFISANPTGLLHLGHARNAAIGDSLANILEHRGYNIVREYYINDSGNQINVLANSIFINYQNLCGNAVELPKESYRGSEILAAAQSFLKLNGNKFANKPFDETSSLIFKEFGINYMLSEIKKDLQKFKVKINIWFSESFLYKENIISNLIKQFEMQGNTYQLDGAIFLKTTLFEDDKDRVIVKKDKTYTYMLPDLAYHHIKFQRSDVLINIWGADHYGYIPRIKAGLYMLNNDATKLDILCMQMVKVIDNGKEQKMSKRAGTSITLRHMIDLIGKDALRYFLVSRSVESHLDIDLALAKQQSNENPVYYAQYVHARINQIIENYPKFEIANSINLLIEQKEKELLITLDEYIIILQKIEKQHQPHLLTNYIQKLAKLFHSYYNKHKVISEDQQLTTQRLTLFLAIKQIMANALNLIGVDAPKKM